jgi:hypothetical protein
VQSVATAAESCLNCGTALGGPFCAQCGQKAVHPKPTLHELFYDGLEEFLHFDGKIVQTLRTLAARPGQLTVDIVAGRRARYIAPLRLYLTCSLIYFLIAAVSPIQALTITVSDNQPGGKRVVTGGSLSEDDRRSVEEVIQRSRPLMRPLIRRSVDDPVGLQTDVFHAWPKAMFVLLPVFAAIVAVFFRGRHFVEHVYFALHVHAFAFLAMAVNSTVALAHVRWLSVPLGIAVLVWLPLYVHFAFKRVYGASHLLTIVKETGIAVLYGIATVPAIFVAALWVASHPH